MTEDLMAVLRYKNNDEWVLLGQGPAGPTGPAGEPGPAGVDGAGFTQAAGDALYLLVTGATMTGPLNMGGKPITGAPDGTADDDPATVGQIPGPLTPPVLVRAATPQTRRAGDVWIDTDPPVMTSSGWTYPVLSSGWVNYDTGTHAKARYRRLTSGYVEVQGLVKGGTTGTVFTLNSDCRPGSLYIFHVATKAAPDPGGAKVDVHPDGRVLLDGLMFGGTNGWLSLSGIGFMAGG